MTKKEEALFQSRLARRLDELRWLYMEPVSYTHLTLPTIA